MRANQETKTAYFNYIRSIELPVDVVQQCSHSGDCEADVKRCMELPEVIAELSEIDPVQLANELREYGCWDEDELSNHNDNLVRILWIATGDISESMEDDYNL